MYLARLQYAPDAAAGGLPPSLSDLDAPASGTPAAQQAPPTTPTTPATTIQGGDGSTPPANLDEAKQKQEQEAAAAAAAAASGEQEGLNPDGTLKEGYEKNEKGEIVKTEDSAEDQTDEDFFKDVDALRGEEIPVEYPEGMDPLSPEGVYHREKVIEQRAVDRFDEYLRKTDPRGYAYLLHRQAGGSDEDFFAKKTFSLPEYEEFKANADLHMRVYKSDLLAKGLEPESVQVLVDKAVKDGKLFDLADQAYKAAEARHQKELEEVDRRTQQANQAYKASVQAFDQTLVQTVEQGKGLNLVIPDADKKGFMDFIRKSVEYDEQTGKFLFVQRAEGENLPKQVEALYLLFKQGDLKALIQREAQTQNRKRLGKIVDKSKTNHVAGGETPRNAPQFVPLGSL